MADGEDTEALLPASTASTPTVMMMGEASCDVAAKDRCRDALIVAIDCDPLHGTVAAAAAAADQVLNQWQEQHASSGRLQVEQGASAVRSSESTRTISISIDSSDDDDGHQQQQQRRQQRPADEARRVLLRDVQANSRPSPRRSSDSPLMQSH